ncbi:MAG: flippase-like domain-containing protein [Chitinophagales bacterium]|jgi:hypothetical protein|nr:flippase-like domain-containing protein [Chitinophagales bacterium]
MSKQRIGFYLIIIILLGYFTTKHSIDWNKISEIPWNARILVGILGAAIMIGLRDLGYMLRIRHLTKKKISWTQAFKIILLWEFGSAITPGMLGGKAVALFLLHLNRISLAKASSVVLLSIIIDEIIVLIIFPILYFIFDNQIFAIEASCTDWKMLQIQFPWLQNIYLVAYSIFIVLLALAIFVFLMLSGLFLPAKTIDAFALKIIRIPILSKFSDAILSFTREIHLVNSDLKRQSFSFWIQALAYSFLAWTGRYGIAICLIWGFMPASLYDFMLIYAKQYALWLTFYIPSTPGSSGLAESIFVAYFCPYLPEGLSGAVALLWRLMSYYIYILIGVVFIFFWNTKISKES